MGLWPKETARVRVGELGPQTGLSLSPHMVLGWELPWEWGCPLGPTVSPGPLQTRDLWVVFCLGSAPALLLLTM